MGPGSKPNRPYYYGLDIVRFFSAMLVALFHIAYSTWASHASNGAKYSAHSYSFPELSSYTWFGWVGVQIFFVISGLVIANSAENASSSGFLRHRALRLYPCLWICASLTLIARLLAGFETSGKVLAATYTIWPWGPFIDGQYWTLGVELNFYVSIYFLLLFSSFSRIEQFALALAAASAITLVAVSFSPRIARSLAEGRGRELILYYGCYFALGISIKAMAIKRAGLAVWAAFAISSVTALFEIARRAPFNSTALGQSHLTIVPIAIFSVALVTICLTSIYPQRLDQMPTAAKKIVRHMGLATYPIYLLHFAIGVLALSRLVRHGVERHVALVISIFAITALAFLIAAFAEPRLRSAMQNSIFAGLAPLCTMPANLVKRLREKTVSSDAA